MSNIYYTYTDQGIVVVGTLRRNSDATYSLVANYVNEPYRNLYRQDTSDYARLVSYCPWVSQDIRPPKNATAEQFAGTVNCPYSWQYPQHTEHSQYAIWIAQWQQLFSMCKDFTFAYTERPYQAVELPYPLKQDDQPHGSYIPWMLIPVSIFADSEFIYVVNKTAWQQHIPWQVTVHCVDRMAVDEYQLVQQTYVLSVAQPVVACVVHSLAEQYANSIQAITGGQLNAAIQMTEFSVDDVSYKASGAVQPNVAFTSGSTYYTRVQCSTPYIYIAAEQASVMLLQELKLLFDGQSEISYEKQTVWQQNKQGQSQPQRGSSTVQFTAQLGYNAQGKLQVTLDGRMTGTIPVVGTTAGGVTYWLATGTIRQSTLQQTKFTVEQPVFAHQLRLAMSKAPDPYKAAYYALSYLAQAARQNIQLFAEMTVVTDYPQYTDFYGVYHPAESRTTTHIYNVQLRVVYDTTWTVPGTVSSIPKLESMYPTTTS